MTRVSIVKSGSVPIIRAGSPTDHASLSGRSSSDAHPTSAITGLDEALGEKQPLNANLTAIAGLVTAADMLQYWTGDGTAALTNITTAARTLLALTAVVGSIPYASATDTYAHLAIAPAGQLLVAGASAPAWSGTGLTYTAGVLAVTGAITASGPISAVGLSSSSGLTVSSGTSALQAVTCTTLTASSTITLVDRSALYPTIFGYSSAYKVVRVGNIGTYDTTALTVAIGVNPITVSGGSFTGDGKEILLGRGMRLLQPNSGATDWEPASITTGVFTASTLTASAAILTLGTAAQIDSTASNSATDSRWQFQNGTSTHVALRIVCNNVGIAYIDTFEKGTPSNIKTLAINEYGGNVYIGADPGGSEKLRVGGAIRTQGLIIPSGPTLLYSNSAPSAGASGVSAWISGSVSLVSLISSGAAANEKVWDIRHTGTTFQIAAANDAYSASGTGFEMSRSGSGVTGIGFFGATPSARSALAAASGTATRTTFDTATVTTQQLAERVKAMIDDSRGYGLHA